MIRSLLALLALSAGCICREIKSPEPAVIHWWTGPPCTLEAVDKANPKRVRFTFEAEGTCPAAPTPGGKP